MASPENIKMQIRDIENKIIRLSTQKDLLLAKLTRIEEHSKRVKVQKENDQHAKKENLSSISSDPHLID